MKLVKIIILCLILITALSIGCLCKETDKDLLLSAVYAGDIASVKAHISNGWHIDSVIDGYSLIEHAGIGDQGAMMHFLISKGASPSIHAAAGCGDIQLLKKLISQGYSVNEKNKNGDTPLIYAVRNLRVETAKYLLDHGALINTQNIRGETALYRSLDWLNSYRNHRAYLPIVKLLLSRGANPNIRSKSLRSPLLEAVTGRRLQIAAALVKYGANVNAQDSDGKTPLLEICSWRIQERNSSAIVFLLQHGADPNIADKEGMTPLRAPAYWHNYPLIDLLVKYGAKEDLFTASALGHYDKAADFIARGNDVNAVTMVDCTPLHFAARNDCRAVAALLISKGAVVDAHEGDGPTPLHIAAYNNSLKTAALLISKGANVNARYASGYTPLHEAARSGAVGTTALLLARGAKVNAMTDERLLVRDANHSQWFPLHYTPLHFAAKEGHFLVSALLVIRGADLKAKVYDEGTAEDMAWYRFRLLSWYLGHPVLFSTVSIALFAWASYFIFSRARRVIRWWRRRRSQPELSPSINNP